ncbi:MAG: lytic transglycosylase domain-containing protein [Terriglobales bacterium]
MKSLSGWAGPFYGSPRDGNYMRKHLVSILCTGLLTIASNPPIHAQGIVANHTSDGRLVYENAPEKAAQADATPKESGLFYWSNTQNRWKPVPPMYSHSGRAAHNAADEVRRMLRRAARFNPQFSANGNALQVASEQVQDWRVVGEKSSSASSVNSQFGSYNQGANSEWIDKIVQEAAAKNAVDPNLVRAIIQVESNFNPHAVSRKGAIGLMQLMPRTAQSLNVSNPYDPAQNVDAGVRHFKELLDSYHGNLELSLAAYNAGAGAVHRSRGVPKYPETRNYVKKITGIYGSNTARLFNVGQPLEFKRDADGHLSVSNLE